MRHLAPALLLAATVLVAPPAVGAEPAPGSSVAVAEGAIMAPAFDPAVSRYVVEPDPGRPGRLTVLATTTDPDGSVRIDGVPAQGATTLTGLEAGDEISVLVDDASGTRAYALVFVPTDFPSIATTVHDADAGDEAVLATLTRFGADAPAYEVALDRNSVPLHVHALPAGAVGVDLKPAPGGHYTVMRSRGAVVGGAGDWDLVELDERFQEVRRSRTVGLVNTDSHDAILRPDGSRVLVAYEPDPVTGLVDAVIQDISATGVVEFTWNSADHFLSDESVAGAQADYAHLNSVDETADGNLLVSFRHTSSIMKIARRDQPGHTKGEIMWRLGGRHSDFAFPDDPDGTGPCAQHTATELDNGHVLVFDNGSGPLGTLPSYCVRQSDGATVDRYRTRVVEYALDEDAGIATTAWSYEADPARFAYFAGSAFREPDGRTVVNWASAGAPLGAPVPLASEIGPDGRLLWEDAVAPGEGHISYRAHLAEVPDATPPEVELGGLAEGAVLTPGSVVVPTVRCTDRGGSTLRACSRPAALDTTTPGPHTFAASARDGAGNVTTVVRRYQVPGPIVVPQPELRLHRPELRLSRDRVGVSHPGVRRTVGLRVRNLGTEAESLLVQATHVGRRFAVSYRYDGRRVPLGDGGWATPVLAPGEHVRVQVRVRARAERPRRADLRLTARAGDTATDRAVLRLRR